MITTAVGTPVRIDHVVTQSENLSWFPTRDDLDSINRGEYVMVVGVHDRFWKVIRHISELRADGGSREIEDAITAAKAKS